MNISKTVMVHVAIEVLAFSYLYSTVNKKTKALEIELEEMRDDYEKKIDDLYEKVEILKNAILQITRQTHDNNTSQHKPVSVPKQKKESAHTTQRQSQQNTNTVFVSSPIGSLLGTASSLLFQNNSSKPTMEVIDDEKQEESNENTEDNEFKNNEITEQDMKEIESLIEQSTE